MSPILGNAIALLAVALLVTACARFLWKDAKRGGCAGCAGCGGGGGCAHCAGCGACHAGTLPDLRELRIDKEARL